MSLIDLLQYLAVLTAMGGSTLIALNGRRVRIAAFTMFLVSSTVSVPVFISMGMMPYLGLQMFYITTALVGLYNALNV